MRKGKRKALQPHSKKCIFVGYPEGVKAWQFWGPVDKHFIISSHAVFDERCFPGNSTTAINLMGAPSAPNPTLNPPQVVVVVHQGGDDDLDDEPPAAAVPNPAPTAPPPAPASHPNQILMPHAKIHHVQVISRALSMRMSSKSALCHLHPLLLHVPSPLPHVLHLHPQILCLFHLPQLIPCLSHLLPAILKVRMSSC